MAATFAAVAISAAEMPKTEQKVVKDTIHGVEVVDPFRWLEGSAAPELKAPDPALDAKVSAWTDAQNAYTRQVLESLPGRKELEARLRPLMEVGSVLAPEWRLNRYFVWKREGNQRQYIIYVQDGSSGSPRILLDPNTLDKDGLIAPSFTQPNHDGKLMAFGLYRSGDENTICYVMNVDSGEWLADEIQGKVGNIQWMPDSSGFFYERLADLKNPYSGQIKYHKLGTHPRQDKLLFEQYKEGPLSTTWGPWATVSHDGRWMILGYWTGTDSNDLWVVDLDRWFRSGEFVKKDIVVGKDATFSGTAVGNILYMQTSLDAPNGQVIAVDLTDPVPAKWKVVIPEKKDALQNVSVSRSFLVADYLKNAATEIELIAFDGTSKGKMKLPGIGSAEVSSREDRDEAFLTFTSFNEPTSVYRVHLGTDQRELWARPAVPVDPAGVEVKQVVYSSKDGTRIPMFIVHRKGLKLDGNNPTILSGYGGFSIAQSPAFSASLFQWYEAGGVYALPSLRGGGEFGEEWHRAGMLEKRQNVFDDFIAAAEWLMANKYTRPQRLAIYGGSNGGLLTGGALVQRPELFGAVISAVPLLDMLRYQNFLMAKYWVPEYGSAEDKAHFEFLRRYSPYQNVKPGTKYPAVFLTAGENDSRVHALHARKMAALLQSASGSDQKEKPVLLWVDRSAGHGQGKPLDLKIRDMADQRIFLMWQLGMLKER